jgi:hypothetical protein
MTLMSANVATALVDIGDAADSLSDGVAALIVIGNAMTPLEGEVSTAEYKALCFVMEKLGQDVERIEAILESVRYRRPASAPEPEKTNA